MTQSETTVALTADDVSKIKAEKMGNGCLLVVAVPALLIFLFFLFTVNWSYGFWKESILLFGAVIGIPLLILIPLNNFIKKKNKAIDRDMAGGRKNIIIAPITDKRIKSSEITRGRGKGGISSKYFMTVAGREYPMTEHKYLTIPVGEFMEIHQAPISKIVLRERWLKQDGTAENL